MSLFQLAIVFFIVTNPLGNSPTIIALIKDFSLREQQKILFREGIFSMLLAIFFLFLGETFLSSLKIEPYALRTSGGILLFIVALKMIFSHREEKAEVTPKAPPFIVPIACPLLSGAGLLTIIMFYSKQEGDNLKILMSILLGWIPIIAVLVAAPYLQIFLGQRGLAAMEQLMGMLLAMIALEMVVSGGHLFFNALAAAT